MWFLAANSFKPAFQFVFAVAQEHEMKANWEPLLFCCLMSILPLQLHRASLSHGVEKMLLGSFGLLGYCLDDLTSFAVQPEAEDPEYIVLAPRWTAEHVGGDRSLHRHMHPARLNKSLNKTEAYTGGQTQDGRYHQWWLGKAIGKFILQSEWSLSSSRKLYPTFLSFSSHAEVVTGWWVTSWCCPGESVNLLSCCST